MNLRFNIGYLSTPAAQILFLIVSLLLMAYFFVLPSNSFNSLNEQSYIMKVTPHVIEQWGHEPTRIKTGFLIHEFLGFDMVGNNFVMNAALSFEFDPSKVSLATISKFEFTKGDVVVVSDPIVKNISDNLTFVQYYIRLQFSAMLDYARFPLDDHVLSLNFINRAVQADQVIFDIAPHDFIVPSYVEINGWNIVWQKPTSGYTEFVLLEYQAVQHPKIIFSLGIKNEHSRKVWLIFIPLFIFFYLGIFQLAIRKFLDGLNSMIAVVTAFVIFSVSIQMMTPKVEYFMLIDYFILLLMSVIFVIYCVIFLGSWLQGTWSQDAVANVLGCSVAFVYIAFMLLSYYLIHIYKLGA